MSESKEPSLMVLGDRRRGRPRVAEPRSTLSTWVPAREYDRLVKMANHREQSLSSLVRDLLSISRAKKT